MSERSRRNRNEGHFGRLPEYESPVATLETPEAPRAPERTRSFGRVALESVRLREAVPSVDWDAVRKLARPRDELRIGLLADKFDTFTPALASAVAHRRDPSIERIMPTPVEVRSESFWAKLAHGVLSLFGLGGWFDRKIRDAAHHKIDAKAKLVDDTLKGIAKIEKPKDQFIDELSRLYEQLLGTDKPGGLVRTIRGVYRRDEQHDADKFPLLAGILPNLSRDPTFVLGNGVKIRAVTPEVVKGVGEFLAAQGGERDESAEAEVRKSASRRLVERVAGSKRLAKFAVPRLEKRTEKITQTVAETLEQAYRALPESGKAFADDVYELCNKVTRLAASGYSGEQITDEMLKGIVKKVRRNDWPYYDS